MTPAQAEALADLICAVINYFKSGTPSNRQEIVDALINIKELPQ